MQKQNNSRASTQSEQADSIDQNVHIFTEKIKQFASVTWEIMEQLDKDAPDLMHLLESIDEREGMRIYGLVPEKGMNSMLASAADLLVAAKLADKYFEVGLIASSACTVIKLTNLGLLVSSAHQAYREIKSMLRIEKP
ncbi:MAG: hypothetical protein M1500_02775 [Candidatus Marsarchaeota archaeon]|jgi:hypothetical protein|nr:hypothetical protein [Candidatus Marsarchaeota archaeon]